MDLPPKSLARSARQHLETRAASAVDKHLFSDIQTGKGSLPVLEAFHEFLDTERKRMRNRMLLLSASFLLLLIVVSAISLLIGRTLMNEVRTDFSDFQADVKEMEKKTVDLDSETKRAISQIERESRELRAKIETQRTGAETSQSGLNDQIESMEKMVNSLRLENESLRKELEITQARIPEISESVQVAMEEIERLRSRTHSDPASQTTSQHPAQKTSPVVPTKPSMMLSIVPLGREDAVSWRLPLP